LADPRDTTRILIDLELRLRNLERTSRGLNQVKKQLEAIAAIKPTQGATDRAALAAQRLLQQQQKLIVQAQELANRQERVRQSSERLALSAQRLSQAQQRVIRSTQQQSDAHVRTFREIQRTTPELDKHVRTFRAMQRAFSQASQMDAHVRAFRALERATAKAPQLDAHVRAFRALQQATAQAPQLDAHVKAFRRMEEESQRFNRSIVSLGKSLQSVGQGLASFGATLSVSLTAPLVALGASVINAAVRMDSLQRGLTTMAGSSREAAVQLERLTQLAKLPGIGFEEAIQGSVRLQAVGFSATEAERALRQFSNAIALTGGGREDLANVTVQLGQMAAQSKVLAQDLKPIISSAPAVARVMREAFGTVRSEEIQELGISSKEFIDTLISGLEDLPRAAAGARNSFENFRDELFRAAAVVGTTLLPALTRLVEVAGPIVTGLANAFAALPVPLQVIGVGFVALLAAVGPVTLAIGVMVTGVGRLLVGFAQLNATGILPTIANLRALTAGTLGAAAAQRTLAATTALVAGGVGALLTVLATVVTAFAVYKAFQKDSVTLSKEQSDALTDQINGLKEQSKFLDGLQSGVERTASEQERLLDIYADLNREAKIRVTGIRDEEKRLDALREEIAKVVASREQERTQAAASIVGELANTLLRVQANEQERESIARRIRSNTDLIDVLKRQQVISDASTRALAARGITASTVETAIGALRTESQSLSESQDALITSGKELNDLAKDQVAIVRALERQTGLSARELLVAAQSMGRFRGEVGDILPLLERYVAQTDAATRSTDAFSRALQQQERDLLRSGKEADAEAKRRQASISAAAASAREASDSFAGAVKFMDAFIAAQPQLRADIQREAQLAGKTFDEFVQETLERSFGRSRSRAGSGLRNAQEQLAEALTQVSLAQKDRLVQIEKDSNEAQLQAAESGQRLRLLSYREYLELRANLTADNLDKEIGQQQEIVKNARAAQIRLLTEAKRPGLQADERARRQAQAAQAEEEAIKAETRLIILQRQRGRITVELQQSLREAQQQQLADVVQLEIQYAELQGRVEDALKAATVEEFRESLEQLGKAQAFLNKEIKSATGERKQQLEVERQLNQRQIESIQNQVRQRDALAQLAAAERLVENAKERQQKLEEDLRFQVEFRGLSEDESIKRRLEGERRLAASMELAKSIIEDARQALVDFGATPPPELSEFINTLKTEMAGLGELSFTEQFRLAEQEFQHLNDERLRRIADVERAVNNRNIAEAEGLLLIRRINGEYVGDLERQLALLKEIASASGDANLERQAQSAEDTVKDASDKLADFDKQLRSTSIDALRSGFIDFFQSLRDNTVSAQEKLLNLVDSVVARINEVIAERLFDDLMASIFGDGTEGGGIIENLVGGIKRLFGFGGEESAKATVADVAGKATEAATASAALTTGATVAATTLTTGAVTASTTLVTAITTAAATFATVITTAGAAFAATVAAGSTTQALGGLGGAIGGGAATGMFPAIPGGAIHIVEGGYPEAVLTTDPRHATRQVGILRELLQRTRGFYGRVQIPPIPSLAAGGIVSRETAEANLLGSINRAPLFSLSLPTSALETAGGAGVMNLRVINQVDSRSLARPYVTSEEGTRDLLNFISVNSNEIARRLPIRGR
jgi:tape measure domain-containing protein